MKRRSTKLRNWIAAAWLALLMSVITYGISSKSNDVFMIAMLVFLSGWCSAKVLSEGFEGLVGIIEDEDEDEHE